MIAIYHVTPQSARLVLDFFRTNPKRRVCRLRIGWRTSGSSQRRSIHHTGEKP
jgi:hypothetical protein